MIVEANVQIRSSTESLAGTCEHDDLDTFVNVKHGEEFLEVVDHLTGEGIVVGWTVQRDDHDGGHSWRACWVVGKGDMAGCRDLFVGVWELQGTGIEDHFGQIVGGERGRVK